MCVFSSVIVGEGFKGVVGVFPSTFALLEKVRLLNHQWFLPKKILSSHKLVKSIEKNQHVEKHGQYFEILF